MWLWCRCGVRDRFSVVRESVVASWVSTPWQVLACRQIIQDKGRMKYVGAENGCWMTNLDNRLMNWLQVGVWCSQVWSRSRWAMIRAAAARGGRLTVAVDVYRCWYSCDVASGHFISCCSVIGCNNAVYVSSSVLFTDNWLGLPGRS